MNSQLTYTLRQDLQDYCADEILPPMPQILLEIEITLKANILPDQALLKGLSPRKEREIIQLTEYSLPLFNLSHSFEGPVP